MTFQARRDPIDSRRLEISCWEGFTYLLANELGTMQRRHKRESRAERACLPRSGREGEKGTRLKQLLHFLLRLSVCRVHAFPFERKKEDDTGRQAW